MTSSTKGQQQSTIRYRLGVIVLLCCLFRQNQAFHKKGFHFFTDTPRINVTLNLADYNNLPPNGS